MSGCVTLFHFLFHFGLQFLFKTYFNNVLGVHKANVLLALYFKVLLYTVSYFKNQAGGTWLA